MSTHSQDQPTDSPLAHTTSAGGRTGRRGLSTPSVTFRLALIALLSVASLGFFAVACGDDEGEDGPQPLCTDDLSCGLGFVCDPVQGCVTPTTNNSSTGTNNGDTSTNNSSSTNNNTSTNNDTTDAGTNNSSTGTNSGSTGTSTGTNNNTVPDAGDTDVDVEEEPDVPPDVREPQGCELTGCPELMVCNDFDTNGDDATYQCEENAAGTCVTDGGCLSGRFCVEGSCSDDEPGCREDAECGDGAYCNRAFDECEQNTCDDDGDCAGSRVCFIQENPDLDNFCGVCNEDSECEGNLVCNFGLCEEPFDDVCENDSECSGTRVCNEFGNCVCGTDADCAGNDVCDVENGFCTLPPCTEDNYAPNEFFSNAAEIEPGLIDDVNMCDAVDEWFLFEVNAEDGVIVELRHDNPDAGMEMDLRADDVVILGPGTVVDAAGAGYLNVTLAETGIDGEIYLRTRLLYGAPVDYSLNIEIVPGGFCVEDTYEEDLENGESTDTRDNPTDLGDRLQQPIIDANLCTADEDWYVYNAPDAEPWRISVEFVNGDDPVGVDLYRGEELLARDTRDSEPIKFFEPDEFQPGEYFIRVYPIAPRHNTNYILRFAPDEEEGGF